MKAGNTENSEDILLRRTKASAEDEILSTEGPTTIFVKVQASATPVESTQMIRARTS